MQDLLTKARNEHRINIRRQQISKRFSLNRQMLIHIDNKQVMTILMESLHIIRQAMLNPQGSINVEASLTNIDNLMRTYQISDIITQSVKFDYRENRVIEGFLPEQCTWIELFLIMVNENWEQSVLDRCSAILYHCALQIKENILHVPHPLPKYCDQRKRLLERYPYHKLVEGKCNIVINTLKFIFQIVVGFQDGAGLYFLFNRLNPSILHYLHSLYLTDQVHLITPIRQDFVATSVILLYIARQFGLSGVQAQNIEKIVCDVKTLLFNYYINSSNREIFQKGCEVLRVLCRNTNISLTNEQFKEMQSLMQREVDYHHEMYLEVINVLLYMYQYILEPKSIEILFSRLIAEQSFFLSQESKEKHFIVMIFKHHLINCGQKLREIDRMIIYSTWGHKACKLIKTLQFLNDKDQYVFNVFIDVLSYFLTDPNEGIRLIEHEFSPLFKYQGYKRMLNDLNYQIEVDEEL